MSNVLRANRRRVWAYVELVLWAVIGSDSTELLLKVVRRDGLSLQSAWQLAFIATCLVSLIRIIASWKRATAKSKDQIAEEFGESVGHLSDYELVQMMSRLFDFLLHPGWEFLVREVSDRLESGPSSITSLMDDNCWRSLASYCRFLNGSDHASDSSTSQMVATVISLAVEHRRLEFVPALRRLTKKRRSHGVDEELRSLAEACLYELQNGTKPPSSLLRPADAPTDLLRPAGACETDESVLVRPSSHIG